MGERVREKERERENVCERGDSEGERSFFKYINNNDINTFVSHYSGNEQH